MPVKASKYPAEYGVEPHAIMWRMVSSYTTCTYQAEDDLDVYLGASFTIGNACHFSLRKYNGHPANTCTLYLPADILDLKEVVHFVSEIVSALSIPGYAIAWRRGMQFEYGKLDRPANDRLRESEARILALKIACQQPDRYATTEFIKNSIPDYFPLSHIDLRPSGPRYPEPHWEQIVRNVISHKSNPLGPFELGYATRTDDGLQVTDFGADYLKSIGFFCD